MMWRNSDAGYGLVAILFHWIGAVLVIGLLVLGFIMVRTGDLLLQFNLYQWHKSLGCLALAFVVLRLVWRRLSPAPRPLPPRFMRHEHLAARTVHALLYLLLIVLPLTGWAIASASPLGIPTFFFNFVVIPHLPLSPSDEGEQFWSAVHAALAYALATLIAVHAAAAIAHHVIARDATLRRMVRPRHQARNAGAEQPSQSGGAP